MSFPFKLLLFVLIDGWMLTVGMLLDSVKLSGAADMDLEMSISGSQRDVPRARSVRF